MEREARLSVDFSFGDVNAQNLDIHDMRWREAPDDVKEAFKQSRKWVKQNWFLGQVVNLQCSFFNHDFQLLAKDRKSQAKLDEWLHKKATKAMGVKVKGAAALQTNGMMLGRFVRDAVREWLTQNTVVSFWRDNQVPFLLLPERCKYTDAMGNERLWVNLGHKRNDLGASAEGGPAAGNPRRGQFDDSDTLLSGSEINRYAANEIELGVPRKDHPKEEAIAATENFLVLTKGTRGEGFGWPELYRVFRTCSQNESMEVAEGQLAMASRLLLEMHKIGWEVKAQSLAHKQADFLWDADRSASILKSLNGAMGHIRTCVQFDHKVEWGNLVDPKQYTGDKWETIFNRLMWWGGPLAFMMVSKSVSPFLLKMLGQSMVYDRAEYVGPHLEAVLNEWLPANLKGATVQWGEKIFNDERLAWDMVKFLTQTGPLSLTSALKAGRYCPEEEGELKTEEAKPANSKRYLPLLMPAGGPDGTKGRVPGKRDGQGND